MYSMNRGSPPHDEVWLNIRGLFKRAENLLTVQRPLRKWQTTQCAVLASLRKTTFGTFLQIRSMDAGGAMIAIDC